MVNPRFIPRHNPKKKVIAILMNVVDDFLRKVDDTIKANRRINIDGVAEELGIGHKRVHKMKSPEFSLEGFLKLIKCLFIPYSKEFFFDFAAYKENSVPGKNDMSHLKKYPFFPSRN
ncbi:hypothetical protein TNCV_463331 [Trichonephila clavipes]|nr:hypothetical protein TNCV_463331 [Trichonephila clavipes]